MATASPIVDILLGLAPENDDAGAGNRFQFEGLRFTAAEGGVLEVGLRKAEATSLRLAWQGLVAEIGRVELHDLTGEVRFDQGRPRLCALTAGKAGLSGLTIRGPLDSARLPKGDTHAWQLEPLASANGTLRAQIVDAHLLFDADVTAPLRNGQVNFNDATVEHVGPDSRMGVSRQGLYVDAPNGRSYLYQFPSTPVPGVEYERRAVLGPFVSDRGSLRLQEFTEWLLRQAPGGPGQGITGEVRMMLDRTSVSGDVRLGDGQFRAPGVRAETAGRAEGHNAIRIHSEAVGRGLALEIASLLVRDAAAEIGAAQLGCAEATGTLMLRLAMENGQPRFELASAGIQMSSLHFQSAGARPASAQPKAATSAPAPARALPAARR
jgi:hypothetical protein